jgi:hypothetical protein
MSTALESIPTTWTTSDERFFHLVARLFPGELVAGASALLASYDTDDSANQTQVVVKQETDAPSSVAVAVLN